MIILFFSADWCNPCKQLHKVVAEVKEEYPKIEIIHCDIESDTDLVETYHIMSVPTLIFLKDNYVRATAVGAISKDRFISMIEELLKDQIN